MDLHKKIMKNSSMIDGEEKVTEFITDGIDTINTLFSGTAIGGNTMITDNHYSTYNIRIKRATEDYYNAHSHCPKCHSTKHSSTYMGYIMDPNNISAYKDENKVMCKCGWSGITHDLISE